LSFSVGVQRSKSEYCGFLGSILKMHGTAHGSGQRLLILGRISNSPRHKNRFVDRMRITSLEFACITSTLTGMLLYFVLSSLMCILGSCLLRGSIYCLEDGNLYLFCCRRHLWLKILVDFAVRAELLSYDNDIDGDAHQCALHTETHRYSGDGVHTLQKLTQQS
jgi:hypothetical protein